MLRFTAPNTRLKFITMACSAALFSGCASTIQSTRYDDQSTTVARGLVYSLPKAQVRISVSRAKETEEDLAKIVNSLSALKTKIEKTNEEATKAKARTDELVALEAASGGPAKATYAIQIDMSKAKTLVAKKALDAAIAELATIEVALQKSKEAQGTFVEKIVITDLGVYADRSQMYIANLNHLPTRDDSMQLSVVDGLLSSTGKAIADDKTADIIVSLANLVGPKPGGSSATNLSNSKTYFYSSPNTLLKNPKTASDAPPACKAVNESFVFDPTDLSDVTSTLRKFKKLNFSFSLQVQAIDSDNSTLDEKSNLRGVDLQAVIDGLAYRPTTAVRILVKPKKDETLCVTSDKLESEVLILNAPDASRMAYLPIDSGALNSNSTSFVFDKGHPKEFSTARASEIAALLKIPVNVAKALISVPGELIKLRVDYSSDEIKLLKNQLDRLVAAQELKDKLKLLDEVKSD